MKNELKRLGLHEAEARVYLYLVEHGVSSPPQISRGTKMALPNCYPLLRSLKEKGLVTEERKGKRKTYIASDPASLLSLVEKRKQAAEELVPELRALYTKQKNKPKVKYYDGWEQVKQIYLQTLETEELWAFGSIEDLDTVDKSFFTKYQKEFKKRQIFLHDLLPRSAEALVGELVQNMGIFYKVAYLPKKYASLPIDILVWNDNVALISLEEPIVGTVITGGYFAQMFKILLQVARPEDDSITRIV